MKTNELKVLSLNVNGISQKDNDVLNSIIVSGLSVTQINSCIVGYLRESGFSHNRVCEICGITHTSSSLAYENQYKNYKAQAVKLNSIFTLVSDSHANTHEGRIMSREVAHKINAKVEAKVSEQVNKVFDALLAQGFTQEQITLLKSQTV